MSGVLIFGEVDSTGQLTTASLQLASAARELASALNQALFGGLIGTKLDRACESFQGGLASLYMSEGEQFSPYSTQAYVQAARAIIKASGATTILFVQGSPAREWVPALAAQMNAGLVTNCTAIAVQDNFLVATKPVNGGSVLGTFHITSPLRMLMMSTSEFAPVQMEGSCAVQTVDLPINASSKVSVLSEVFEGATSGPRLKEAGIVISGGRGVGGETNWHHIEAAAQTLSAAVGCSRPVAEAGWLPSSHQVGLSGTTVAPNLYIAVGISGAPQHLAGITAAKMVVAINNDENADIFKRADLGVVGDFAEILKGFTHRVKALRG